MALSRHVAAALLLAATLAACTSSSDEPEPSASTAKVTPTAPAPSGVERVALDKVQDVRVELDSPDWLVPGFGSLWVKRDNGSVVRLSPNGKVQATIDADVYQPPVCQGLGVTAEAVWACATSGTIIRIDPRTNKIAAKIVVPNLNEQGRLASFGGNVWLLTGDGHQLTGISERTNRPGSPIKLGAFCTDVADRVLGSTLWVVCASDGVLLGVDLTQRKIIGKVTGLPLASSVSVGADVWVGFEKGLAKIDPSSHDVTLLQEAVTPISIRAVGDHVWVREEGGDAFLSRLDAASAAVRRVITAKDLASGGDVLEFGGAVWASASDDGTVVRLSP